MKSYSKKRVRILKYYTGTEHVPFFSTIYTHRIFLKDKNRAITELETAMNQINVRSREDNF